MQTTKRGTPDFRRAPTRDELTALTGFSYKEGEGALRISFSKTHTDSVDRVAAWNATVHRNVNGTPRTWTVYAGTDRTLPKRFASVVSKIAAKVSD